MESYQSKVVSSICFLRKNCSFKFCHSAFAQRCLQMQFFVFLFVYAHTAAIQDGPEFLEPVLNVSVPLGREAILQCSVKNLGDYQVAWLQSDADSGTLLSVHEQVIAKDSRIRVSQSSLRNWRLHIREVTESDRGFYMCQINTQPMISQMGYLDVLVPPKISDSETSSDVMVDERGRLSIVCKASGYPLPTISWRREDGKELNLGYFGGKKHSANRVEGDHLNISQISREEMGAYLCIASNGVPPSVSKRISVQVNFRPKIRVYDQLIGAELGSSVTLECFVEASPRPLTSWLRQDQLFLLPSAKYELSEEVSSYRVKMRLRIKKVDAKDYGAYKCVAKNTLGEKEGYIRLYRPETPSTTTSTTTTTEPITVAPPPSRNVHYENKFDDLVYDADGFPTSLRELAQKVEEPSLDNGRNHKSHLNRNNVLMGGQSLSDQELQERQNFFNFGTSTYQNNQAQSSTFHTSHLLLLWLSYLTAMILRNLLSFT